jgi:glycosyltransferase involved in cell wall biosynthesis
MMSHSKIKVLVQSNYCRMVTGFGKNMKNILLALHKDPDIEVFEASNGVPYGRDTGTPWESYGTYPSNPQILKLIEKEPVKKRAAQYGFYHIDDIVEKVKPDVFLGIEDIWAFREYEKKKWWPKTKKIIWTTLDSLPILDQALETEPKCDQMLVWASFAEEAMKELGHKTVSTVHGAVDYSHFKPLENRDELRNLHGLDSDFVIGFVFKNQLRKSVPNLLEGFKRFKKRNPEISTKLLLHTDWGEKSMGWDIPRYLKEKELENGEVLATYVCHKCDDYFVQPYSGEDKDCSSCGAEKSVKTKNSAKGVGEKELNEIYNLMDVYCHPFTSGGQELPIQEAKAAGLITLVTDYSCGTDSAYEHQGGLPLAWNEYREPSTQFIKATTCPNSICERLEEVYNMSETSRSDLVKTGIEYVKKEFSVENTVSKLKHFIKTVELKKEQEKSGQEGKTENKKASLNELLKDVPLKDRIAVVLPRSAGDVLIANSLMENLQSLYPNKKIFFVTNPEYYELINDNPFVYKTIPYTESFENLYSLEGQGPHKGLFEIAFLPHCITQKTYSYTHNGKDKNQFELR